MSEQGQAIKILTLNTVAFTICFMCWMMNGVLITFLVDNGIFDWSSSQMGWLIGIPVLSGSLTRLPVGLLTDRYGGRIVYGVLMLVSAALIYLVSLANSYTSFLILGLGFGLTGASFAVGIAYTSVWFAKENQGFALGVFGAGNAGAAVTSIGAPHLLSWFTAAGQNLDGWRMLPRVYAVSLLVMGIVFLLFTETRMTGGRNKSLAERLAPLKVLRVWRFGLYYFLLFGGFVALAQWLIPYYVNSYSMSVAWAGFMAATFSLPSGVIRAFGGWVSDKVGARTVMQWVLVSCVVSSAILSVPRMDISSPGSGVMARYGGTVASVGEDHVVVSTNQGDVRYDLTSGSLQQTSQQELPEEDSRVLPHTVSWHEPVVEVGDEVAKKQLLARGVTHVFFPANVGIFTLLVLVIGVATGMGAAAVYKHIPDYFPDDIAVVGGMVGVLGGLGGFFLPILFGYLLEFTGLWATCWMFLFVLSVICLVWMNVVVKKLMRQHAPEAMRQIDTVHAEYLTYPIPDDEERDSDSPPELNDPGLDKGGGHVLQWCYRFVRQQQDWKDLDHHEKGERLKSLFLAIQTTGVPSFSDLPFQKWEREQWVQWVKWIEAETGAAPE